MSKSKTWFGHLDAGTKSSPVALDERLATGDPKTVYLFNLARREFVEYNREIVEPKLRELEDGESAVTLELKAAFERARRQFSPRGGKAAGIPERTTGGKPAPDPDEEKDELAELIGGDEDISEDDDEENTWSDEDDEIDED
jgi:hypothetical protein